MRLAWVCTCLLLPAALADLAQPADRPPATVPPTASAPATAPADRAAAAAELAEAGRWQELAALLVDLPAEAEPPLRLWRATARARLGQWPEAARDLAAVRRSAPNTPGLAVAEIDLLLRRGQPAAALARLAAADAAGDDPAQRHLLAARAYSAMDRLLGDADVRVVPGGRPGHFDGQWLLVEARDGTDRFLCCPPESALYQVRRALAAGLTGPDGHLLHARIWMRLGRTDVATGLVETHADELLRSRDPAVPAALAEVSLAAGDLRAFLHFADEQVARDPDHRSAIMLAAMRSAADLSALRGDVALHLQFLQRALELAPDDAMLLLAAGDAAWDAGQPDTAVACYRRLLARDPQHPDRLRLAERIADHASP
jgi:tetratricopeptide (TPR) repeat protein